MTNLYGLYRLGYTHVTMALTKRGKNVNFSKPLKRSLSSDYCLEVNSMKLESLVIVK